MPAEQDFDSIAVAIQNTADDGNRLDGLAALRRLKAELLAAQERAEKAEYDALMANKVVEANSVARWQSVETKKAQRVEAELAVAQEREKALHRIANSEHFDAPERDETHPPAIIARDWARAALAGSPSEKPGSGQNHPPITSANPKAKRELAEKPGSEEEA